VAGHPLLWDCNGSRLARRAHRNEGRGGRAALCARAPRTQDLLVPGLGGWSAGYPLLFRSQRVMTRAVKASPAARPSERMRWMVCRVPVAFQIATGADARSGGATRPPSAERNRRKKNVSGRRDV
jgi:hypothetical protein